MTTQTVLETQSPSEEFKTGEVLTIVGGHFVHDTYSSFIPPLLPLIIERLSISLTSAAWLQIFLQLPTLLNPFIGQLADKVSLRYFVILAPTVTATLMSLLGLASNYMTLAIILLIVGVSVVCFHAPAPAMVSRISGQQVGKGMSLFMAGGELGRTVGPLVVTWAVSEWTLAGFYPLMVVGWGASLMLFWRLRRIPARTETPKTFRALLPTLKRLFIPLLVIVFFRSFLLSSLFFLPTFMTFKGASLWMANVSLAVWELAGVAGALLGGTLSDRIGRRTILLTGIISSSLLMIVFLSISGWLVMPILIILGFTSLSTAPVMLAISQEHLPNNRAVSSGIYITMGSLSRLVAVFSIGWLGDRFDLPVAFLVGAIISLVAIPAVFFLPQLDRNL